MLWLLSAPNTAPAAAATSTSRISPKRMRQSGEGCRRSRRRGAGAESRRDRTLVDRRVDAFAQFLARLEVRHVLARQGDRRTGLRIAAHARWPVMQRKTSESANFDPLAARQRLAHLFEG